MKQCIYRHGSECMIRRYNRPSPGVCQWCAKTKRNRFGSGGIGTDLARIFFHMDRLLVFLFSGRNRKYHGSIVARLCKGCTGRQKWINEHVPYPGFLMRLVG